MAGGIDWFRWHHGSVTDPKFRLVAKKAGARTSEVLAVWASLLESASASEDRGNAGKPDFEALDLALDMDEGTAARIYERMCERDVIDPVSGRVVAWEKRQPKRERPEDDTAAERKRQQRARDAAAVESTTPDTPVEATGAHVTPSHAKSRQKSPRGEERREEKEYPPTPKGEPAGFVSFWTAWPKSHRKGGRDKCLAVWSEKRFEAQSEEILAHVAAMSATKDWTKEDRQFVPAPIVYLRSLAWTGAEVEAPESFFAGAL